MFPRGSPLLRDILWILFRSSKRRITFNKIKDIKQDNEKYSVPNCPIQYNFKKILCFRLEDRY